MFEVKCPIPAKVLEIHVNAGDVVAADTVVVTIESMKMEMPVEAGMAGTVSAVSTEVAATVQKGEVLIVIG